MMNPSISAQQDQLSLQNTNTATRNGLPMQTNQSKSNQAVTLDSLPISFDGAGTSCNAPRPKMRADQLSRYAKWLQQEDNNRPPELPTIKKPRSIEDVAKRPQKLYRVDSRHGTGTTSPQSPDSGIEKPPHFETLNYVPPIESPVVVATMSENALNETTAQPLGQIPLGSLDSQIVIKDNIRELIQAGRIIGELDASGKSFTLDNAHNSIPMPKSHDVRRASVDPMAVDKIMIDYETKNPQDSKPVSEAKPFYAALQTPRFNWPKISGDLLEESGCSIGQLGCTVLDKLGDHNRVAITSSRRGEGCSTIAISLARWATAQSKSVLLVDADLSNPGMTRLSGIQPNVSWFQTLNNSRQVHEVTVQSLDSNLSVLPLSRIIARANWPAKLYDKLANVIEQVESNFDLVVLDLGPFAQVLTESTHPIHLADAFIIASAVDQTSSVDRTQTQNKMLKSGIGRIIIAENFVNEHAMEPALVG